MVSGFDGFGSSPFGGIDNFMFTGIPIFIGIIFVIVIIMFIVNGAKYVKNATSTRESTFVRIVSKRMDVRHSSNMNDHNSFSSSHTYYYITLEFENGERKEYLDVKNLYGLVAEGDEGYAAIQGDWIVAFERSIPQQERSSRY
ncbi:DUF2500 domain-containing protein [Paenibacillus sp. D2_2]|uniref:DUF2500 domain-containing protein n=1 Tax=Paenibacillus sp. D2_2 TaxID=3073092 RepID=UPI0028149EAB|nr:DUF2500 domain-containing protein [Paenibacillus sp. D2_2]WMT40393.1 DUF2500 domain-containing protein [Paenibacillus sp. D2_2]